MTTTPGNASSPGTRRTPGRRTSRSRLTHTKSASDTNSVMPRPTVRPCPHGRRGGAGRRSEPATNDSAWSVRASWFRRRRWSITTGRCCRSSTSLRVRASSASRTRTSTARNGAERCSRSPGRHGRLRQPDTDHDSHRAIRAFLHWARKEGYEVDPLILDLSGPRVPKKEPTVTTSPRQLPPVCSAAPTVQSPTSRRSTAALTRAGARERVGPRQFVRPSVRTNESIRQRCRRRSRG